MSWITWLALWPGPYGIDTEYFPPGKQNEELNYYFLPIDLVTAPEILFFWVARMNSCGLWIHGGKSLLRNVYLTGIVRDKTGRKKDPNPLGNSPDPLDLILKYGCRWSPLRECYFFLPCGNDLPYGRQAGRARKETLPNKSGNCFGWFQGWEIDPIWTVRQWVSIAWFESRFNQAVAKSMLDFEKISKFRAFDDYYKLMGNSALGYLEMISKPEIFSTQSIKQLMIAQSKFIWRYPVEFSIHLCPFIQRKSAFDQDADS